MALNDLIYDRVAADVARAKEILAKAKTLGWDSLSASEQEEYASGDGGALYDSLNAPLVGSDGVPLRGEDTSALRGEERYTDFQRVEDAITELVPLWEAQGNTAISGLQPNTWAITDIPTPAKVQRLLNSLRVIRALTTVWSATPPVPANLEGMDYEVANALEKIVADVWLLAIKNARPVYSGEIYCGEDW